MLTSLRIRSEPHKPLSDHICRSLNKDGDLGLSFSIDEYNLPGDDKLQKSIYVSSETVMHSESLPTMPTRPPKNGSVRETTPTEHTTKARMRRSKSEMSLLKLHHHARGKSEGGA